MYIYTFYHNDKKNRLNDLTMIWGIPWRSSDLDSALSQQRVLVNMWVQSLVGKWRWLVFASHEPTLHILPVLGATNSVAWRNGSCVASKDCTPANSISALTYSIGFGFWVNTTCCQGNCQEPSPLGELPPESGQMGGQGGGGVTLEESLSWIEEGRHSILITSQVALSHLDCSSLGNPIKVIPL